MSADSSVVTDSFMRPSPLVPTRRGRAAIPVFPRQLFEQQHLAEPLLHGLGRSAAVAPASRNITIDVAGRSDLRAFSNPDVIIDGHPTAQDHHVFQGGAARDRR